MDSQLVANADFLKTYGPKRRILCRYAIELCPDLREDALQFLNLLQPKHIPLAAEEQPKAAHTPEHGAAQTLLSLQREVINQLPRALQPTEPPAELPLDPPPKVLTKPTESELYSALVKHWSQKAKPEKASKQPVTKTDESILTKLATEATKDPEKYSCEHCEKFFETSKKLNAHLLRHNWKKSGRYSCEICKKAFAQKSSLTAHIRIHTGEKPYHCETCDKRYSDLSTYKKHCRTHTKEKPYACELCDKTFSQSGNKMRHMRSNHPGQADTSLGQGRE